MDLSCECDCDCERWSNRVGYELVASTDNDQEQLVERMYCEQCFTKVCALYHQPTHTNPWQNT